MAEFCRRGRNEYTIEWIYQFEEDERVPGRMRTRSHRREFTDDVVDEKGLPFFDIRNKTFLCSLHSPICHFNLGLESSSGRWLQLMLSTLP